MDKWQAISWARTELMWKREANWIICLSVVFFPVLSGLFRDMSCLHRGKSELQRNQLFSSLPCDERTDSDSTSYFPRSLPPNFSKAPPDHHETKEKCWVPRSSVQCLLKSALISIKYLDSLPNLRDTVWNSGSGRQRKAFHNCTWWEKEKL